MAEVNGIIRLNHAGERGAIAVYSAKLLLARILYKDMVDDLEEMLRHERDHFATFGRLLASRKIRACYGLAVWAMGGAVLGTVTALLGRNAIWVCTDSIETTVLHHLQWQLELLNEHDAEAYEAVLSIKEDEEAHQALGAANSKGALMSTLISWVVRGSTAFAIWISMVARKNIVTGGLKYWYGRHGL